MADNLTFQTTPATPATGTIVATDDVGGTHFQKVKIDVGGDGASLVLSNSNPLPIGDAGGNLSIDDGGNVISVDDGGGSLTVDGTVSVSGVATAANQSTANTALAAIQAAVETIDNTVAGSELQVDVVTSALPSGAATAAKQPALGTAGTASADVLSVQGIASMTPLQVADNGGTLSVDDNGATLSVDDGGSSLTVDGTVAATQSGNWSARMQDGAGNALTSKAPGSERALSVAIVDASGNQVTTFGGSGGTSQTDDAAFTPASGSFTPVGGIVTADSVDSGDGGAFAMLANRQQKVTLYDSSGNELSVGGGTQYTEDAVAAGNPVGNALMMVRDDALSGQTSDDGDNVAARGTDKGELYVKHVDAIPVTDNGGNISIDDGGNSITIDGTVAVSGTVTVDGSGVTQPVSHAALTELAAAIDTEVQVDVVGALPAGTNNIGDVDIASIAAGDNNIGNVDVVTLPALPAGTNNIGDVDVLTLPSTVHSADYDTGGGTDTTLAFGIAVPASGGAAVIPGDATAGLKVDLGADNDVTVTGSVTANAGTNLNTSALALESGGNLAGAATSLAVLDDWDESDRAKVNPIAGQAGVAAGAGAVSALTQRVTLASDDPGVTALQLIDDTIIADDAAFTPGTSKVSMAGFQADESSTDSVNEGDAGAARMTLDRKLITTLQPHTAGGLSIFRSLDIDETEEDVKTSAGVLYSIAAFNRTAAPLYLKFYNATAANVTVGSTTPVLTFVVPGNADSDGAGFILEKTYGWTFDTAISVSCTTGVADSDTGAPGANDCVINLGYL